MPHPRDPSRLAVAMSTGGVNRSDDAGDHRVLASLDEGDTWPQIAAHLPDVLTVRAVVV